MSVLARRQREQDDARHRALLSLRDGVFAAVTRQAPDVGSVAIEEAVDAALARMLEEGAHRCEPALARNWWIKWAREWLISQGRSPAFRQRDRVPVDEHPRALALGAQDDPLELLEDDLTTALVREILATLRGPQREWAQALFAQLLGEREGDGEPLPGLSEVLGWSAEKTKKTAQRACTTMTAFVNDRATGKVCSRRQAVLSTYITATEGDAGAQPGDASRREFEAVASHLAGCPECYVAWRRRRSTLLERCGALIMVPLDSLAAAGQALTGKLAGLFSGAQNATLSLLGRLGLGGGAAAAGGSAAAISTKTAAVCAGLVCAAGAGVGEITGVLPPLSPSKTKTVQVKTDQATVRPPPAPVATPAVVRRGVRPTLPPPPPPPPPPARRAAKTSSASATSSSRTPSSTRPTTSTPSTTRPRFTPGDLPPAISQPPAPPPAAPSSGSATGTPASGTRCVPGSLGC